MGDQDKTDPFNPADNETVRKGERIKKNTGGKISTEIQRKKKKVCLFSISFIVECKIFGFFFLNYYVLCMNKRIHVNLVHQCLCA